MDHLKDMLLQYAIESGEIKVPQALSDEALLQYAIESAEREIEQGFTLVDTLEELSGDVISRAEEQGEDSPVTEECLESYHRSVGLVLKASGFKIPASVVVPSFESAESAEEGKKSVKDKVKGVANAVIKWIKDRLKWLAELFTKAKNFMMGRAKKAEATAEKAKEDAAKAKAEGVDEVVTPEGATEEEKKGPEGDKKPAKFTKVVPAAALPQWAVSNDRVNLGMIKGFADGSILAKDPKLATHFLKIFKQNADLDEGAMMAKIFDESFALMKKKFPHTPTTAHWRASVHELDEAIGHLKGAVQLGVKGTEDMEHLLSQANAELDKLAGKDNVTLQRQSIQQGIAVIQKGIKTNLESQKYLAHLIDVFAKALSHAAGVEHKAAA